jgi:hypothetical protein
VRVNVGVTVGVELLAGVLVGVLLGVVVGVDAIGVKLKTDDDAGLIPEGHFCSK